MKNIIELKNVNKYYETKNNKIIGLKDVSINIKQGSFTIITGHSGSGKTTLLNIIGSLIKTNSGNVIVNGNDISKYSEKQKNIYRKKDVSIIFQNYNLLEDLTAYENILLGKKLGNTQANIDDILKKLNLLNIKNSYPNILSRGEAQRVSIARAIAKGGDIFLCDEPTGALDIQNSVIVLKILQDLAYKDNKTVVVVSHDRNTIDAFDHLIEIKDGIIIKDEYNNNTIDVEKIKW